MMLEASMEMVPVVLMISSWAVFDRAIWDVGATDELLPSSKVPLMMLLLAPKSLPNRVVLPAVWVYVPVYEEWSPVRVRVLVFVLLTLPVEPKI